MKNKTKTTNHRCLQKTKNGDNILEPLKWLFLLAFLFFVSCKKDKYVDDFITETQTPLSIEELKKNLSGNAIDFFDLDYLSTQNPNVKVPEIETDQIESQALSRNESKRETMIQIVYDALLQQNADQEFVSSVINEIGYPIWDKSMLIETENEMVNSLILPFAKIEDNFVSASVLINIVDDTPDFFIRADKIMLDDIIEVTLPESVTSEDIPFHLAAFLNLDSIIFNGHNVKYLNWLDQYDELNTLVDNQAGPRCESVSVTFCVCDLAFDGGSDATTRNNRCYTATISINCDQYDGDNGTIDNQIPSGNTFPGNSSGGSSTNNNTNNSHTEAQELLEICNNHINATGDEGSLPDLLPVEIQFCGFLTDILTLVSLSDEEVLWLNHNHINNSGFFSHLTLIRAYLLSDDFDPLDTSDQDMFDVYMDFLVSEVIDIPIRHFAHVYDFKNEYGYEIPYETLIETIDEANCISSGNFNLCAWESMLTDWAEDFDLSPEDLETMLASGPLELGGRVTVPKKDWSILSDEARVNYIFNSIALIHKIHKNTYNDQIGNSDVTYNIADDIFTNVSGTGNSYTTTTNISYKLNGQLFTVNDVGFTWSRYWTNQNFYWHFWRQGNSQTNKEHFLFTREGALDQFGNAVIDFVVPSANAGMINARLDE